MATTPPALDSLRVTSIRETVGLPPLETLTQGNTATTATTRRRTRATTATVVNTEQIVTSTADGSVNNIDLTGREPHPTPATHSAVPLIVQSNSILSTPSPQSITVILPDGTRSEFAVTRTSDNQTVLEKLKEEGAGSSVSPAAATKVVITSAISTLAPPIVSPDSSDRLSLNSVLTAAGLPAFPVGLETKLVGASFKKVVPSYEELKKKKGYYIVPRAGRFHYFKIPEVVNQSEHLFKFVVKPPTFSEGMVFIDKEMYYVTLKDLQRGIIRKIRKISVPSNVKYDDLIATLSNPAGTNTGTKANSRSRKIAKTETGKPISVNSETESENRNVERLIEDSDLGIIAAANLALEKQISSLYSSLSEEEVGEWIIEKD